MSGMIEVRIRLTGYLNYYEIRKDRKDMKFLFFDIETVRGKSINNRIVSFGYVLTDENFNIIEKEDIFINPQEKAETDNNWEWKQEATKGKEGFKKYYKKIKDILTDTDTIVVGHGADNDVQYLSDECDRYHFEQIDFTYYDTYKIAKVLFPNQNKNLKALYEICVKDKKPYQWHRSLDDACMTKDVFISLFNRAKGLKITVLENDDFMSNSLKTVYGDLELDARKGEDYFSVNFDMPIIVYCVEFVFFNGLEERKKKKLHLYFDYTLDQFFTPKHPKKGNIKEYGTLSDDAYKKAKKRGAYKIKQMLEDAQKEILKENIFYMEGYQLKDIKVKQVYLNFTSYEIYACFSKNALYFDFNVVLNANYFKNAIGNKIERKVNIEQQVKKVHSFETASKSLCAMAKMKFGYKDKDFPPVQEEEYIFREGDTYCLARTYYDLFGDKMTRKGVKNRLIRDGKEYIPVKQSFENNLCNKLLEIPVVVKRDHNGDVN